MAKKFDKLLEKATDATLVEADWEMIMNAVDCVRSGEVPPKAALASVRKRYHVSNPHVCHHALLVLEALVKNCGDKFHREVATKECMEDMKHLAAESSEKVKEKILELIQCWAHAFREKPEYKIVKDTNSLMKLEGFAFPAFREADAMFVAEVAPEWVDAESCFRCKASFGLLNRKHHCRNCGQIFCDKCSGRQIALPHIGIEKEVRVCETCFDKILKSKPTEQSAVSISGVSKSEEKVSSKGDSPSNGGKSEEATREDEELQLALAISQSEAEEKERQRQRDLLHIYNGPPASHETNNVVNGGLGYKGVMDNTPASGQDPSENELARYLNRDYWEQRRVEQKTGILRQSPTPSAPTSESSPMVGTGEDGIANSNQSGSVNDGNVENGPSGSEGLKNGNAGDLDFSQFALNLRSTVDVFINRIRSDQMRGRSVLSDGTVQTMFMTLTNMHSQLLKHLNELDDRRGFFESQQDKLTQIRDAREAIEALRDEHEQHRRAEQLELQRQRQIQMFAKLGVMRQKKNEMLEQQRLLAVQRMEEERRLMDIRKQMQMQQQVSLTTRYASPGMPTLAGGPQQPQQPVSYYGGQQQQGQPIYYGPSGVPASNPYEMHQMAASLPTSGHQQPPLQQSAPTSITQQTPFSSYGQQYPTYGPPSTQFQGPSNVQVPTFPQGHAGGHQQQQQYFQPAYNGQPAQTVAAPMQPQQVAGSYYPGSPAHAASPVPQQQQPVVYPTSLPAGYPQATAVPSNVPMPQYVPAPTSISYSGQHQGVPMPQGVVYQPSQQMAQQTIPEAQLISFD